MDDSTRHWLAVARSAFHSTPTKHTAPRTCASGGVAGARRFSVPALRGSVTSTAASNSELVTPERGMPSRKKKNPPKADAAAAKADVDAPPPPPAAAAAAAAPAADATAASSSSDKKDDKTSADYYFDSYSHFGIHEVRDRLRADPRPRPRAAASTGRTCRQLPGPPPLRSDVKRTECENSALKFP